MEELDFEKLTLEDVEDDAIDEIVVTRTMEYDNLPVLKIPEHAADDWYESRCTERWANVELCKANMERRMHSALSWKEFYDEVEHCRVIFENKEDYSVPELIVPFLTDSTNRQKKKKTGKRVKSAHVTRDDEIVTVMAMNERVALVLCRQKTKEEKEAEALGEDLSVSLADAKPRGTIWAYNTSRFGDKTAKWHNTGIAINSYVTCWIHANVVYIVAGSKILVYVFQTFPRFQKVHELDMQEALPGLEISKITVFRAHDTLAILVSAVGFVIWSVDNGLHLLCAKEPSEGVAYTTATVDYNNVAVGRTDGCLETYRVMEHVDGSTKRVIETTAPDLLVDRVTSDDTKKLVKVPKEPIQCLHLNGFKIVVTTEHSVVAKEQRPPEVCLVIDECATVADSSFFCDLMCSLQVEGGLYVSRFASGRILRTSLQSVGLVDGQNLQVGLQRTAFMGHLALGMLDNGYIVGLDLQRKKKKT